MIRSIRHTNRKTIKTFTLDHPQPVKSPYFLIFPVKGKLEIKDTTDNTLIQKHLTIGDFTELRDHIYD